MKTIFITFPFGIAARNIISARIVGKLRKKGFRVVVFAPLKAHKMLREIYPDPEVILENYPKYETFFYGGVFRDAGILERILIGLINASLETGATIYRRKELLFQKRYFRFIIRWIFQTIFSGHYGWSEFFRKLDEKFFPDPWFKEYFDKYKPCAVFSPHVQFDFNLIKRAKAEGVPSFGQILSVDNLTTKGNIRTKSDYLFVWNDVMKEEAACYNLYNPEYIISVGIPQYDLYFDKSILMSREEFCRKINADPLKKILVYASEAGDSLDDIELVEFLLESQEKGKFIKPINIVARSHPRDTRGVFGKFVNNPNVIVNDPYPGNDLFIDHWYPSIEQISFLVNLMYHSSIVFMMGSTIGLDATGFNKPVISLGFDLLPKPYCLSVRRYYDYFPHQRHWFDTGAFRIATDRENLIKEINRYLEHPEHEDEERKELVNKLFYKFDGRVGDRIVKELSSRI